MKSRLETVKKQNYTPEIKPELLELIMNQPPDQQPSTHDMTEVGWDVIETVKNVLTKERKKKGKKKKNITFHFNFNFNFTFTYSFFSPF